MMNGYWDKVMRRAGVNVAKHTHLKTG